MSQLEQAHRVPNPSEFRTNIFQSSPWLPTFLEVPDCLVILDSHTGLRDLPADLWPADNVFLVFMRDVATFAEQSTLSPLSPWSGPPLFVFPTLPDNHLWHGSCLGERWKRGRRERLSTWNGSI